MSEHKVGDRVTDMQAGASPVGSVFRHLGDGYFAVVDLPLQVGDVIDTAEQAARLPVGSVVVDEVRGELPATAPAIKTGDDRWLFHNTSTGEPLYEWDTLFDGNPHRIVHIPSADAGAGGTAA